MKHYWVGTKQGRFLVVSFVVAAYILLLLTDGVRFFPQNGTNTFLLAQLCLRFGFSAIVAVLFLAVGAFTWLYARDRHVATLLFSFTISSMISITVQTAALQGDTLLSAIGGASGALSLLPLFALLLIFPKKPHTQHKAVQQQKNTWRRLYVTRVFLSLLSILSLLSVVDYVYRYAQPGHVPTLLEVAGNVYFPLIFLSILALIPLSYLRSPSLRERQRVRFFLGGIVLTFAPLLILTVLPVVTAHSEYAVDGQVSSLFYFLLPLSIGYSVLRPQMFFYDSTIRRTVTWIIGTLCIGILGYVTVVGIGIALANHLSLSVLYAGVGCALLLSPCLWWLTSFGTERLFFQGKIAGYPQLLETASLLTQQRFDLKHVSDLLVTSAQQTFETEEACLFVRGTNASTYLLYPAPGEDTRNSSRKRLIQRLHSVLEAQEHMGELQVSQRAVTQLISSHRPLLLNDLLHKHTESVGSVSHYLNTSLSQEDESILFAPIWARGEMVAILVLGKRADQQSYGGPDFDVVQLLFTHYASELETARVTEELRVAYERQKELDMLKDQFIMTASHELRTPLTAVVGYLDLLDIYNGTLTAERRANFITKAHRSCDELTLMVNNIMDANRVQGDIATTTLVPVLLEETVVHITEIVESLSIIERRTMTMSVPPEIFVTADAVRLRQVLLNLVSNALKYSPSGTPIEIFAEVGTEYVTVCVRDFGSGVPVTEQNRLFERFVRLERDMNSPKRGTGLGLYICRKLVHAMGGRIWVESTGVQGEGSRFVFTLPLASPTNQKDSPTVNP